MPFSPRLLGSRGTGLRADLIARLNYTRFRSDDKSRDSWDFLENVAIFNFQFEVFVRFFAEWILSELGKLGNDSLLKKYID